MVQIRKAKTQDLESILKIWLEASVKAHHFIPTSFWQNQLDDMRNIYLPSSKNYVLEKYNTVIGFASVLEDNSLLVTLFIDPKNQGQGYGSSLIEFLKQHYPRLDLKVYAENTASVHFYQKHGFQVIEKSMDEHTKHDEFHMTWLKEK